MNNEGVCPLLDVDFEFVTFAAEVQQLGRRIGGNGWETEATPRIGALVLTQGWQFNQNPRQRLVFRPDHDSLQAGDRTGACDHWHTHKLSRRNGALCAER